MELSAGGFSRPRRWEVDGERAGDPGCRIGGTVLTRVARWGIVPPGYAARYRGARPASVQTLLSASHRSVIRRSARYDKIGEGYALTRREDPHIAQAIRVALGDARSVVNVGAGTGSYEPDDRYVIAVEPSDVMAAQRPADDPARTPCKRRRPTAARQQHRRRDGAASRSITGTTSWSAGSRSCAALPAIPS